MFSKSKLTLLFLSALVVLYALVGSMVGKVAARDGIFQDLSIFTDVLDKIQNDYVERPDLQKTLLGALQGMVEALDSSSSFVHRDVYRELSGLREQASPGFIMSKRFGYGYVVSVVPGSPADAQAFRNGDWIVSIDGRSTTQMSLWEIERRLRGPAGSLVELRVVRMRGGEPVGAELRREEIVWPEVKARVLEEGVGWIQVSHLRPGSGEAVRAKLKMLLSSQIQGLLLDLRGNAAGDYQEALEVAELFIPAGQVLASLRGRRLPPQEFVSREAALCRLPLVVLVDSATSGAAEVLAAALKDNAVAEVVGLKTNGSASEFQEFPLNDGSVLMLAHRLYYRPNGAPIQGENARKSGIVPDLRSPPADFASNFYFEQMGGEEAEANEEFYRRLNSAIDEEQLKTALERVRRLISSTR